MQYLDLKAYFQEKLGDGFTVQLIRDVDAKPKNGKVTTVVNELAGNIYENSAQLPIQIDFYTRDPIGTSASLNTFIVSNNGKMFVNDGNFITIYYTTPTALDKNIEAGPDVIVRLTMFGSVFVMFNMDDIATVKIDGEVIETMSRSISYNASMKPNNKSGTELKKHDKIAGFTTITMRLINKRGVFSQKLRVIRNGTSTGNTVFSVSLTYTDGYEETYAMLLENCALASVRGQLPSMDVAFVIANQEL